VASLALIIDLASYSAFQFSSEVKDAADGMTPELFAGNAEDKNENKNEAVQANTKNISVNSNSSY
jgi:hypothetical protein